MQQPVDTLRKVVRESVSELNSACDQMADMGWFGTALTRIEHVINNLEEALEDINEVEEPEVSKLPILPG